MGTRQIRSNSEILRPNPILARDMLGGENKDSASANKTTTALDFKSGELMSYADPFRTIYQQQQQQLRVNPTENHSLQTMSNISLRTVDALNGFGLTTTVATKTEMNRGGVRFQEPVRKNSDSGNIKSILKRSSSLDMHMDTLGGLYRQVGSGQQQQQLTSELRFGVGDKVRDSLELANCKLDSDRKSSLGSTGSEKRKSVRFAAAANNPCDSVVEDKKQQNAVVSNSDSATSQTKSKQEMSSESKNCKSILDFIYYSYC